MDANTDVTDLFGGEIKRLSIDNNLNSKLVNLSRCFSDLSIREDLACVKWFSSSLMTSYLRILSPKE